MGIFPGLSERTLSLIFPPRCLLCGDMEVLAGEQRFCTACDELLQSERHQPGCPTCGRPVGRSEVQDDRCRRCLGRRPNVRALARVGYYQNALAYALRSYKYCGNEAWGPIFLKWLTNQVNQTEWVARVEAVVTVPTHWQHRLGRPLYPPRYLAASLGRLLRKPVVSVLRRIRAGPHQVGLGFHERMANIRGAFALQRGVKLNNARLLLIDDVRTTGATLEECARTLKRHGAAEVYGAVLLQVAGVEPKAPILNSI